jgi:hypothetical protein
MSFPGVSVYVLRERLQESWEKRESLRQKEEDILREAVGEIDSASSHGSSYFDLALDAVVQGTKGFDNLQSWRTRFLSKPSQL